jgi:glucokinase
MRVGMTAQYIAGLDIGGTKMAAIVADASGPLARVSQPTIKSGTPRAPAEQAIALVEAAAKKAGVPMQEIGALGVGACGPFVHIGGMLSLAAPNICGARAQSADLPNDWDTIPLEQVLRERFARVVIENDCVAALVAERGFGALRGEDHCAYVTWSTGIGFGLCVDGHILHGKHGNAGHAGHMLMSETSDALCGCGNRGDLEGMISGRHLGNRLMQPTADLFTAARAGDSAAHAAAEEAGRWFGRALYNLTAVLDIRAFAIGGSVWNHHGDWLAAIALKEIASRLPALTQGVELRGAALGAFTANIGALALAMPQEWAAVWRKTKPWQALND